MRKKGHKKINAQNKSYDRFYMINYLELGMTWEQVLQREGGWESVGVSEERCLLAIIITMIFVFCLVVPVYIY